MQYAQMDSLARLEIVDHPSAASEAMGSPVMAEINAAIAQLAAVDCPILLVGEAGTGKSWLAHRIHTQSRLAQRPFVWLDGRGTSELTRNGSSFETRVKLAGVLYISNASDLRSDAQEWIMQAISRPEFPRVILGTCEKPDTAVRSRRWSSEFLHRAGCICLHIPPLRMRREQVRPLAERFLEMYSRVFERPVPELSRECWQYFDEYSWQGNIAELETAIKSLVALGDEAVTLAALRASALRAGQVGRPVTSLKQAAREASQQAERILISEALIATRWNRKRAAERLQISYKALLYKVKQAGLESPRQSRNMETMES